MAHHPVKSLGFLKIQQNENFEDGMGRESVIAISPYDSYHYAKDVLKGRFGPGEKAISRCSMNSLRYSKDVLKGRFPLGEKVIFEDDVSAEEYEKDILKKKHKTT